MDKALQREKTLARVKRYREKKALQVSISGSVTQEGGVTAEALQGIDTTYHPILSWLIDPVKREKFG